jgi:threonine dehydratase
METFRLCRDLLDGVVLVDNAAISAAIQDVFNETRNVLEPAGAVGAIVATRQPACPARSLPY